MNRVVHGNRAFPTLDQALKYCGHPVIIRYACYMLLSIHLMFGTVGFNPEVSLVSLADCWGNLLGITIPLVVSCDADPVSLIHHRGEL